MILFLLLTLFAWIGTATLAKVLWFSSQPDQWIDQLFNWQDMLDRIGRKHGFGYTILYKALGGCEFCFAHAVSFLCFWFYVIVISFGFHVWPQFDALVVQCVFNLVWYIVYVSTGTVISSLTINRL